MATISNSAAGMLMGWKCYSKVLALPSSPKQQLVSIHISSSLKYNISHFNQFSSRLLSKPQSHAIPTTLRNTTTTTSNLQQEEDYVAAERFTTINSVVGSCTNTAPGHRRNFVDMLSRILASLLSYGIGFTFITMAAFLFASNSALAASYGCMGGSSSSSSYSSSSSSSSDDDDDYSYYYESSANKTCTCDTSCTQCIDCDIKKQGYKQEKRFDNSCSCICHRDCFFHKEINHVLELIKAIPAIIHLCLMISLIISVIVERVKGAYANGIGTLLIFQVGVSDKQRVLQRKLNKIAENTDTSTLEGLNYVLKETVRALLQHDISSFNYSYLSEKPDSMKSLRKAFQETLDRFDEFVKDEEVFVNVDGVKYQKKKAGMVIAKRSIDNEYTLATMCVLASGKHCTPFKTEEKRKYIDSFDVLQTLVRIPKNNIKSVRVMWTPQKQDEILTEEDLRKQTNLKPIVNGRIFLI